jgi:1,4-dihydroxy-2-naphthoate octaprenyltransferase
MFGFLVFAPFVILLAFACQWLLPAKASLLFYFPLLALPSAFRVFFSFLRTPPSPAFNAILFKTVRLEALFAGLFTIGALLNGPLVRTMI